MTDLSHKKGVDHAQRKASEILDLKPEKRLKALINLPNSKEIARAIPPQDFWLTYKRLGMDERSEALELASGEQLVFIQDIDGWIGDKPDRMGLADWLEALNAAGADVTAKWLRTVEPESFMAVVSQFMAVSKPDEGSDPADIESALPPVTFDGVYYLHYFDEDSRSLIHPILALFASMRQELYFRLMEALVWEWGPETEEMAIRFRDGRLRDYGIPDFEESIAIYQRLDEKNFYAIGKKSVDEAPQEAHAAPRFGLATGGKKSLVDKALAALPDGRVTDEILSELALLSNKVVVADALDIKSDAQLEQAVAKVKTVVNMGLETLTGGDAKKAAELLAERWLVNIFQVGYGSISKLYFRASKIRTKGWMKKIDKGVRLLPLALKEIFVGLARKNPLWHVGGKTPYRFFAGLDEVKAADEALDTIDYLGKLFVERLELANRESDPRALKNILPVEIDFETILRTALVNAAAGKGFVAKPLSKADVAKFMKVALLETGKTKRRKLDRKVRDDLIAYLDDRKTASDDKERRIRDELVDAALHFIEDELGKLNPADFDVKYIQGTILRER